MAAGSPLAAVLTDLYEWMCEQPLWRQQAFRYLLSQTRLEDEQRAEVRDLLLAEVGYSRAPTRAKPKPLEKEELVSPVGAADVNRLRRLFGLTQVNALPESTELRFDPDGLTVVYGPNGAGKSSYVRSLKRLCRTVDRDESILPNVLKQGAQNNTPRARIEWQPAGGGPLKAQQFDLADPALRTPIGSMSIFDSRCAQIYVDEENQLAFVPSVIRVLISLAEEQMAIQTEVDALAEAARQRKPDFSAFPVDTKVRTKLDALSVSSQVSELEGLAALDEEEMTRRGQLDLALAAAASGESERQQAQLSAQAKQARELIERLKGAAAMLSLSRAEELRGKAEELARRREVVRLAAEQAFAGEDLAGVGSDPWRELWEAARRFYGHAHVEHADAVAAFPDTREGAPCPLCFQGLDLPARDRFRRFEAFVQGDAEARAAEAERALRIEIDRFTEQTLANCRTAFLDSLSEMDSDLHREVEGWLKAAGDYRAELIAAASGVSWPSRGLDPVPTAEIDRFAVDWEQGAEAVRVAVKPEEKEALQAELAELKAREVLAGRLPEMRKWIDDLGEIDVLERAKLTLRTQGISLKQKALTEQVVTQALKDQLRRELDALGFTNIAFELKARGEHGATMIQLQLRDAPEQKLASILSDGEKRSLALAFFLAEISTADHAGGIILDDPVSSLDQERRDVIARRVAEESGKRQVILFTHDIAFLFHVRVEAEARGAEPKMQQVWRDGAIVGRTAADAPFEASRVKERIGWLERMLQEMPKEGEFKTADEQRMHVSTWYEHLRRSWERAVEEIVFNETVQRFTPRVQTQRLKGVKISEQMLKELEQGMTNCSNWVHDQPIAEGARLAGRAQMREDLDAFRNFCTNYRPK